MKSTEISSQPSSASELQFDQQTQEETGNSPKNTQKKLKLSKLLIIIAILGGGITLWQIISPFSNPATQTENQGPPPRPVETIQLTSGTSNRQIRLLGQVEAGGKATLSPQIDGTVQSILVKEGDPVTPGMTVAILDDADAKIALAQAKAKLVQEKSNLARLQVGTRAEIIEQRQAELNAAQAREQEALDNLQSLIALQPDLIAQRQAELDAAITREQEAQDNLQRIKGLSLEGALSERALVEAESTAEETRNQRLRAKAALTAQETESRQDIAQARTRLDNAKSDRLRMAAMLAEAKAGPTKEEIDAQKGVVSAAEAAVKQAELARERTKIKATFSGIVQTRDVDPGDYVEVNEPLLTLVSDRSLDIFLEIPESLSGQVTEGMRVNLLARALPNWEKATEITAVVPAADTSSRRQLVRVTLNNPPQELLPGMAIQADLVMPITDANTFTVPRDALTRRGDQWLLFTVNDNQAQQLAVDMIADLGEEVVIRHPRLRKGKSIVIKGGDGLTDKTVVKTVQS